MNRVTFLEAIFDIKSNKSFLIYNKMLSYINLIDDKIMKWNLLVKDCFKPKCIEYIEYNRGDNLGWHEDMGSLITIVIMLSNDSEYNGGIFQTRNDTMFKKLSKINPNSKTLKTYNIPMNSGDCVIFHSDYCNHRVIDLINGTRKVLCMELILW